MAWIKLYETYNKVKKVFIKPKLYFKLANFKIFSKESFVINSFVI